MPTIQEIVDAQVAYNTRPVMIGNVGLARNPLNTALGQGLELGQQEFIDDPEMLALRRRREELSQGLQGAELSALRKEGQAQIQGTRSQYLKQLASRAAKGGIGGARSAAISAGADRGFMKERQAADRKLLLDQAGLKRQGTSDLQDFIFRQKFGRMGVGLGLAQLTNASHIADRQMNIAKEESKSNPMDPLGIFQGGFFGGRL